MSVHHVCAAGFVETHPTDAARLIEQYPASEAATFLEGLPPAVAAGVLERMSLAAGADCLGSMSSSAGAAIMTATSQRVAVALLRRVPEAHWDALLAAFANDTRERFRQLLSYRADTVGSITDPSVLALPVDLPVREALDHLRRHHRSAHHHVYVVDRTQRLLGVLHIRDLVSPGSKGTLADIMQPALAKVVATSRLAGAAAHPAWRKLDTLPVTDDAGVLLGMVRYRHLRHLDAVTGPGAFASTLLGLGELYWLGLAMFLPVASGQAEHRVPASGTSEGNLHHAH